MSDHWMLTPYFLDQPEPDLVRAAPRNAVLNTSDDLLDESPKGLAPLHYNISGFVERTLDQGGRPITFSGDCMGVIPAMAGVQAAGLDPWLVWIDAHGDFNTPDTSPSGAIVGMPLAMMTGRGPQGYCTEVGLQELRDDRIVMVDVRDLDPGEEVLIEDAGLRMLSMEALAALRLVGPVHVHFDPDVISATDAPGFRFPAAGGPSTAEVCAALKIFAVANDVRSISLGGWTQSMDLSGKTEAAVRATFDALTGQSLG